MAKKRKLKMVLIIKQPREVLYRIKNSKQKIRTKSKSEIPSIFYQCLTRE